jgi:hypothetical protein
MSLALQKRRNQQQSQGGSNSNKQHGNTSESGTFISKRNSKTDREQDGRSTRKKQPQLEIMVSYKTIESVVWWNELVITAAIRKR